jgi:hypothetical protein
VHYAGPPLAVLILCDPHLLEGGETGEDGTADPGGALALRRGDHLDTHGGRGQGLHLLLQAVLEAWEHGASTGQDDVAVHLSFEIRLGVATAMNTTSVDSDDDDDDDDDDEWEQSCSDDDDGGGGSVVVGATPHSTPAPELTPVEPMTEAAAAVTVLAATAATPAPLVATPAAQPARQRQYQGHERAELGSTFRRPPSKRRKEPLVLVCKCGYCGRHVTCDQ